MYLSLDQISQIQLDHTSRCNLGCPQCARTLRGWSKTPENQNIDLSLDDYKIIFEPLSEGLKVFHCGNYGDAIASPTFNETFTYTLNQKPREIKIATNGSLRSEDWWKELAQEGGDKLVIDFAIDGLEDTHSIYRVGSRWSKLMKNVQAFINAGGKANWNFLEFEHNYHQAEEAKKMAKDMGFKAFRLKSTGRFVDEERNKKGKAAEELKEVSDSQLRKQYNKVTAKESFEQYIEKTEISCKFLAQRSVFIDMNMTLWPCCWFGVLPYMHPDADIRNGYNEILEKYGSDFLNMRKYGWSILNHDFYEKHLEKSWDPSNLDFPKIFMCGKTCGQKYEHSSGYGPNLKQENLRP